MPQISGSLPVGVGRGRQHPAVGVRDDPQHLAEQRAVVLGHLAAVARRRRRRRCRSRGRRRARTRGCRRCGSRTAGRSRGAARRRQPPGTPSEPAATTGSRCRRRRPCSRGTAARPAGSMAMPSRPRSPPVVIRSLMSSTTSVVPVSRSTACTRPSSVVTSTGPGPGASASADAPAAGSRAPARCPGSAPAERPAPRGWGARTSRAQLGGLRGAVGGAGVGGAGDGELGRELEVVALDPRRGEQATSSTDAIDLVPTRPAAARASGHLRRGRLDVDGHATSFAVDERCREARRVVDSDPNGPTTSTRIRAGARRPPSAGRANRRLIAAGGAVWSTPCGPTQPRGSPQLSLVAVDRGTATVDRSRRVLACVGGRGAPPRPRSRSDRRAPATSRATASARRSCRRPSEVRERPPASR